MGAIRPFERAIPDQEEGPWCVYKRLSLLLGCVGEGKGWLYDKFNGALAFPRTCKLLLVTFSRDSRVYKSTSPFPFSTPHPGRFLIAPQTLADPRRNSYCVVTSTIPFLFSTATAKRSRHNPGYATPGTREIPSLQPSSH